MHFIFDCVIHRADSDRYTLDDVLNLRSIPFIYWTREIWGEYKQYVCIQIYISMYLQVVIFPNDKYLMICTKTGAHLCGNHQHHIGGWLMDGFHLLQFSANLLYICVYKCVYRKRDIAIRQKGRWYPKGLYFIGLRMCGYIISWVVIQNLQIENCVNRRYGNCFWFLYRSTEMVSILLLENNTKSCVQMKNFNFI